MIYDLQYKREHGPVKVFDGNDREVFDAVEVDSETGRVTRFKRDNSGRVIIDWRTGQAVFEDVMVPLPIRVEQCPKA